GVNTNYLKHCSFPNLERLVIRIDSSASLLPVLTKCPKLQDLHIDSIYNNEKDISMRSPNETTLPIKTLVIQCCTTNEFMAFMSWCPNVTNLTYLQDSHLHHMFHFKQINLLQNITVLNI